MKPGMPVILSLLLLCGCASKAEKEMGGGEVFVYPELETFEQNAVLGVAYAAAMGDWNEVKNFAQGEQYTAAVSAFEASSVPSAHSGRQGAKDGVVSAAKTLAEKANANASNDEIEAAYKALQEAIKTLRS